MSTVHGGQGNIVTSGLVLNLDAANPRSYPPPYNGTTWTDLSGNNNGTLVNGPTYNSSNGGSVVFDGVDDYVNFTSSPSTVVTVSVWINLTSVGNYPIIVAGNLSTYDSNNWNWSFYIYQNIFYVRGNPGPLGNINVAASTLVNVWTNWVLVRNDGTNTCRVYRNGTLFGSSNESGTSNSTLGIGRAATNYYSGRMANVQIYNRVLSASEILQNFNATRARFGI